VVVAEGAGAPFIFLAAPCVSCLPEIPEISLRVSIATRASAHVLPELAPHILIHMFQVTGDWWWPTMPSCKLLAKFTARQRQSMCCCGRWLLRSPELDAELDNVVCLFDVGVDAVLT
jgi:hypothetical protein